MKIHKRINKGWDVLCNAYHDIFSWSLLSDNRWNKVTCKNCLRMGRIK